jgi:prepilin-type processing-associated H-X9-DG protein
MAIPYTCPNCGKSMVVDDQFAGQTGPCSACGKPITIPSAMGGLPPQPRSGGGGAIGIMIGVGVACLVGCLGIGGVVAALLLPAVQAARTAARRSQSSNNLKQIVLAMHNYHDTYRQWPPAYVADENGKPLYSWRVVILPFMEQNALYQQFDKNKAWDDPANLAISQQMVSVYRSPGDETVTPNGTNYFVIVGAQTAFPPDKQISLADITDGTSNTIAVMELKGIAGSWAAPIDPDMTKISPSLGNAPGQMNPVFPGGTNVAMCDGSVRFLSSSIQPNLLQLLILRNDGQAVTDF